MRTAGDCCRVGRTNHAVWLLGALVALAALLYGGRADAESCVTSLNCKDAHRPVCGLDLQCHPCANNTECTAINAQTSTCLTDAGASTGECTQPCVVDGGTCSGPTPICSGPLGLCVGCSTDNGGGGSLACPDPNHPACQGGVLNTLNGSCTQCRSARSGGVPNETLCQTTPSTPACDPASGQCGCNTDSDCAKGRYCDRSGVVDGGGPDAGGNSGICQIGCRVATDAGPNGNCPTGKTCVTDGGPIGVCQGQGCSGDGDCTTAPFTKCDTGNTHQCVQCTQDTDCTGGKVCETDGQNPNYGLCVQCTQGKKQACTESGPGDVCLANSDTCGCGSDSDCGDRKSGRVCGGTASSHTCIPGCRGTNGNGCPDPDVCSSKDDTIGTCSGTGGDGGANDGGGGEGGSLDGSADGASDGSAGGVSLDGAVEGGGCSCNVAGSDASPFVGIGVGLLALSALARRRRDKK